MYTLLRRPIPRLLESEIAHHARFDYIRYAQCWEDADVLLAALEIQPGDVCLAIASAGDNALAMLTQQPKRVIALDLNAAQLACLELRVSAYRNLSHPELLGLIGSSPWDHRTDLYHRCRGDLSPSVRHFWDQRPAAIAQGIGNVGKFERYLAGIRRYVLPWVQSQTHIYRLLQGRNPLERQQFYDQVWNTWQWRSLFRLVFSRSMMGRFGRDPSFFRYVQGNVGNRLLERTQYAMVQLNPPENPYLQWILTGYHPTALPYALRPEHFATIRANLDRLEWHHCALETFLSQPSVPTIHRFNLSDVFEYLSPEHCRQLFGHLLLAGCSGSRFVYWNMMAPRHCPPEFGDQVRSLSTLAQTLYAQDKAWFYQALVIEEIQ
jgi:S-adenosylmethionine-diacylglycerol 3-amino-3-carboxypropyl transferase